MTAEEQVEAIRDILEEPWTPEYMVFRIRQVLTPHPDPRPLATDEHGWPMLNPEGTAWERHDDPEAQS